MIGVGSIVIIRQGNKHIPSHYLGKKGIVRSWDNVAYEVDLYEKSAMYVWDRFYPDEVEGVIEETLEPGFQRCKSCNDTITTNDVCCECQAFKVCRCCATRNSPNSQICYMCSTYI